MIVATVFSVASVGFSVRSETQQSPREAAMATSALDAFLVSSLNLISIPAGKKKEAKYEEEQY